METIDEPLVKIVPTDVPDKALSYSPFLAKKSAFEDAIAKGHTLSDYFGLPIKSEAQVYDIYEIRPHGPTTAFVNTVAPTSELHGLVTKRGGGEQCLLPNRSLFSQAELIGKVGNDLTLHNDLLVSKGLAPAISALDETVPTRGARPGLVRGAVALGSAATVADAIDTGERVRTLLQQDNLLGAKHEARDFFANSGSAWTAAYAVGKLGAQMGGRRGLYGAVAGGIAGGVAGYVLSDEALERLDMRQIAQQTDALGQPWNHNGREWVRSMQADLRDDGVDQARPREFSADFDTRRELEFRAANTGLELAFARLPTPRNPYALPADAQDPPSARPSSWERHGDTGQWTRRVYGQAIERGPTPYTTEPATAERAARLDAQASQVIAANIDNGPAPLAARFNVAYQLNGFDNISGVRKSPAVESALDPDTLQASDGRQYRRGAGGAWRSGDEIASGNTATELSATRAALQPQLEQHSRTLAGLPAWEHPTQAQQDVASLAMSYAGYGVAPTAETLAAIQHAVNTTRIRAGLDASDTSLALDPDAAGARSVDSPIAHLRTDAGGVVRTVATTTADDIERARGEIRRGIQVPAPDDGVPTLAAVLATVPTGMGRRDADAERADPAPRDSTAATRSPVDENHPDHAMLLSIREGMTRIDRQTGKPFDDSSERLCRSLLAHCKDDRERFAGRNGGDYALAGNALNQVDHVVMSKDGRMLFAVQGGLDDPKHRLASVDVTQGMKVPVEQSDARLEAANLAIAQERQRTQEQTLSQTVDEPTRVALSR